MGSGTSGGEIWTYGINKPTLTRLAILTGGRYLNSGESIQWEHDEKQTDAEPLQFLILALAALSFVGGLLIGGAKP